MKKIVLIVSLIGCCSNIWANPQSQNSIKIMTRSELVGLWGMSTPTNKKCTEYYNFKSNNQVIINSGQEWSYGTYDYQPSLDVEYLPSLTLNIRYDNNQVDCSGEREDQSGEMTRFSVKWNNPSTILFCDENTPTDCFATLRRILP